VQISDEYQELRPFIYRQPVADLLPVLNAFRDKILKLVQNVTLKQKQNLLLFTCKAADITDWNQYNHQSRGKPSLIL
jgi:hypothetical protein